MRPLYMRGGIFIQYPSAVVSFFQYYTCIAEEKLDIQIWCLALLKNIMERDSDSVPEFQRWFDRQFHRENVSQYLKPRNFNKTFRIYQHISLLLFMRNRHSAAPDAHISPV